MASKPLTDVRIRAAKPRANAYKLPDQFGLHLLVWPAGSKLWRLRYTFAGKESMCSLGAYPDVGLAEAREERDRIRKLIKQGINPSEQRRRDKQRTSLDSGNSFRSVAEKWIEHRSRGKGWRPGYLRQVQETLKKDVYPLIGSKSVPDLVPSDFRSVLNPIIKREAFTVGKLVEQWMIAVGQFAVVHGFAEVNSAASVRGMVEPPSRVSHPELREQQLPEFFRRLNSGKGTETVQIAVLLLAHTFVRPSELRCAEWPEFDFSKKIWSIPASRMKMKREHIVPLTDEVIALLDRLRDLRLDKRLLLPNIRDRKRPMSPTTMNRLLERLGYGGKFSAHGFRATASTILNSWGVLPDAIEYQLAHQDKNAIRRIYNRADYMAERVQMMRRWSAFLASQGGCAITSRLRLDGSQHVS